MSSPLTLDTQAYYRFIQVGIDLTFQFNLPAGFDLLGDSPFSPGQCMTYCPPPGGVWSGSESKNPNDDDIGDPGDDNIDKGVPRSPPNLSDSASQTDGVLMQAVPAMDFLLGIWNSYFGPDESTLDPESPYLDPSTQIIDGEEMYRAPGTEIDMTIATKPVPGNSDPDYSPITIPFDGSTPGKLPEPNERLTLHKSLYDEANRNNEEGPDLLDKAREKLEEKLTPENIINEGPSWIAEHVVRPSPGYGPNPALIDGVVEANEIAMEPLDILSETIADPESAQYYDQSQELNSRVLDRLGEVKKAIEWGEQMAEEGRRSREQGTY
jgi:hypothetical protein